MESKDADVNKCTALLAKAEVMIACGTFIAGDTAENKHEFMKMMRMYCKNNFTEKQRFQRKLLPLTIVSKAPMSIVIQAEEIKESLKSGLPIHRDR